MVSYIRSDLDFILKQIQIAEAHAAGGSLIGAGTNQIPANNIAWGLRTVDGTYNNLVPGRENWGAADQEFPELLDPVFRPGEMGTDYNPSNDPDSVVVDSAPRTISNLIVDQTISNPAAVEQFIEAGLGVMVGGVLHHVDENGDPGAVVGSDETLTVPNVSPDEGLSASFNSWFTLFGQFFDHGLDLVNKGGSGTVFVPLQPDDPLYDADGADNVPNSGDETNFMVLTRATVSAGPDNIMGTADDVRPVNTTTSFVDQNQTYTSHPAHQVFLREYVLKGGEPVATGNLIRGEAGGMATWADVKEQAREILGINLTDADVGNGPLIAVDPYGNFLRGPNGFPQVVFPSLTPGGQPRLIEGDPTAVGEDDQGNPVSGISTDGAFRTGHAFLADIAHEAVPIGKLADGDIEIGLGNPGNGDEEYDNELLDAHFIAGDGRANENIGLTAVHHVFHAEHNRLAQHTKDVALADAAQMLADGATQAEAVLFLNEWLTTDVATVPVTQAQIDGLDWDGERLFQAAKFGTEMQYQHLVFEEFARKIQPQIDIFLVPDGFDVNIDPTIVAEFAHVVYRFGHSMLTESIDRYDSNFTSDHIGLIEGFLNPVQFDGDGAITHDVAAGAIVRGMTRQVGNEIDEFVTGALRNNLLGLPLDLATINLARGRDAGVPSLNEVRRDFYEATNNAAELRPYESWTDFAGNIKNPASIVNFVAAYGLHPLILGEDTIEGKRDAALTIITGDSVNGMVVPLDAVEFLNSTGAWNTANSGLDNVDLWIGGLAEKILPFGGMLGSTFNFVFETQMENLQNGDRFYYLQRLDGLHLFGEMENNSFASMIMRNTDALHLPSDVFSTPGLILEVDRTKQYNPGLGETAGDDGILNDDPNTIPNESADNLGNDPQGGTILTPLVIRNNPSTSGADTNYLRYTGSDHVVLGGTDPGNSFNPSGNDVLIAGIGDDAIYGDGGDDQIEGGAGNDVLNGGAGHDIIRDLGGDDNIKAGDGNDVVHAGPGLDLVMGGAGQDFIVTGTDAGTEVFAGEGNDFILGNKTAERILGNEGNDWIEIGTFDGAPGDNFDEIFALDKVKGHDVFLGDGGFDEFIAEGGDDIMVGSAGRGKLVGMSGFDWATYKNHTSGANADLFRLAFDEPPLPPPNTELESYEGVEGLSGSAFNDVLRGSDVDSAQMQFEGNAGSVLDSAGIARIIGLQEVVGAGVTSFDAGNIILGGDGDDIIEGRGGDDILDGDKWLDVSIGIRVDGELTNERHASMTTLVSRMFSGEINPGELEIVREIRTADGSDDTDTAVFSGNRDDYTVILGSEETIVIDNVGENGTDTLRNIELIQFADMTISAVPNVAPTGQPVISDTTPTEGQLLTVSTAGIADADGMTNAVFQYQWQQSANGTDWINVGTNSATFLAAAAQINQQLQVVVSFTDDEGHFEQVVSDPTTVVGDLYVGTNGGNTFNGTAGQDNASGLNGNDTLNGNAGDDTLNGGNNNDTLNGGTGADTMIGGSGNDTYDVDDALDTVTDTSGTDTVRTTLASYTLGNGLENLTFTGTGDFAGTGNNLANRIQGGAGNDSLNGGTGNDRMVGGAGNDSYFVNATGDVIQESSGGGTDAVFFSGNGSYTLSGNVENFTRLGTGGTANGNGSANTMTGGSANDTLNGNGGADTLIGGTGNDSLNGGAANDILEGWAGNDTLNGGTGSDSLNGGAGNDNMNGGGSPDVFIFQADFGADQITAFDSNPNGGQGLLDLSQLGISTFNFGQTVTIAAQAGGHTLITVNSAGIGNGDIDGTIRLLGVNAATVTEADFALLT